MKILVTGANGLLGQKLIALLTSQEHVETVATARGANRLPATLNGYTYCTMDIADQEQVLEVMAQEQPQVVIHTAAMTQVDDCEKDHDLAWQINVTATQHVIAGCQEVGAHLVHLSTDFIFSGEDGPYEEEAQASPVNYYGETKLAAEKAIMASTGLKWTIVRTVLVYGVAHDMSRSNIILWVKKSLESQQKIKVVDDQFRSPTLAEDLAMGCWLVAKHRATGVFHISGKEILTPYDMAVFTADYFGLDKGLMTRVDSTIFTQPAKRPPKTGFIIKKAMKELGYTPHTFQEGIATVAKQLEQLPQKS